MAPDDLRAIGEMLHGRHWQVPLAQDLGVNDRTLRHWVAGKFRMSAGAEADLITLAAAEMGLRVMEVVERLAMEGKPWPDAGVVLKVYKPGGTVVSPHRRAWSAETDHRIMARCAEILNEQGMPATVEVVG